jgi:hypothetical protein
VCHEASAVDGRAAVPDAILVREGHTFAVPRSAAAGWIKHTNGCTARSAVAAARSVGGQARLGGGTNLRLSTTRCQEDNAGCECRGIREDAHVNHGGWKVRRIQGSSQRDTLESLKSRGCRRVVPNASEKTAPRPFPAGGQRLTITCDVPRSALSRVTMHSSYGQAPQL